MRRFNFSVSTFAKPIRETAGGWETSGRKRLIVAVLTDQASDVHEDPKTIEERRAVAGECETALRYGIKTYVDEMDDRVNQAYAGWPTRLYLVGLDGKIVYAGGQGPMGFKPAKLKKALEGYLESL